MFEGPAVELIGKLSNAIWKGDQIIVFSSSSTLRYCTFEGTDWEKNWQTDCLYTVTQKERIFSNNCNFFKFSMYKKYVNTKTTCNKCSFDYLHWLLNYGKLYRKDDVLLAVHTSGASPQSSASHLLTFLVAQLQFICEWKLSDRRLYEVFERRLLIWGNPKERNRRQIKKHAFFLRHSVYT